MALPETGWRSQLGGDGVMGAVGAHRDPVQVRAGCRLGEMGGEGERAMRGHGDKREVQGGCLRTAFLPAKLRQLAGVRMGGPFLGEQGRRGWEALLSRAPHDPLGLGEQCNPEKKGTRR